MRYFATPFRRLAITNALGESKLCYARTKQIPPKGTGQIGMLGLQARKIAFSWHCVFEIGLSHARRF